MLTKGANAGAEAQEQLTKYLTDAHAIERQALAQLETAPRLSGDPEIAAMFSRHLAETEAHERLVRERLEARDAGPAKIKDILGSLSGKGFVMFARAQPDTPGKLVTHSFSYEHMELAAYEMLASVAERAGDAQTAEMARLIAAQERAMAQRLASCFDTAIEASLRDLGGEDLQEQLNKYLADAHAIEAQSLKLLEKATELAGTAVIASVYEEHRSETEEQQRMLAARLQARGATRSRMKDAALALGALNWGAFFQAQPDTPAKLAAFAYAFEHLEIGGYELLKRIADRAGDVETAQLAEQIVAEERRAAERVHSVFERALDATLIERGAPAW